MSEEGFTGITVSFKPGGTGYDSPLVVFRANTEEELLDKLNVGSRDLAEAVSEYHGYLRKAFVGGEAPAEAAAAPAETPIWASGAKPEGLTPNPDGTYPPCRHGSRPRKPWTSPRNGKRYLFCSLDKGAPGACESVVI